MAKRVNVHSQRDFTGGLNLKADAFLLGENESPDLLNVDVDPRGGFRQRDGVATFANTTTAAVLSIWHYTTSSGTKQVMVGNGTNVLYTTGSTWSTAFAYTGTPHAATFNDLCYVGNGSSAPQRWDGSTATALTQSWNETIGGGATGNMPIAKYIAAHNSMMFIAYTNESGTSYPNRLRFSHPGQPEKWRSLDYIDIDPGVDGDVITGIVPFGDRLYIFKRDAIYALYGYDADSFQIVNVSRDVGAVDQDAIVATDHGIYFFSWPEGVFRLAGEAPEWLFERIHPKIQDGTIPDAYSEKVRLGFGGERLWVALPYGSSATNRTHTFVFDPVLESWVLYNLPVGPFLEWQPPGSDALFLASYASGTRVLKLEQDSATDDFGSGATAIDSYYLTRWFDLGEPAYRKRWKRPEFVVNDGSDMNLVVEVYRDYDLQNVYKSFRLVTTASDTVLTWDHGTSGQWDEEVWGGSGGHLSRIVRGSPMGNARAVALKFVGPIENVDWRVDHISLKYIVRPLK